MVDLNIIIIDGSSLRNVIHISPMKYGNSHLNESVSCKNIFGWREKKELMASNLIKMKTFS